MLGATVRNVKTADPLKDKPKEKPAEVPISEMIMQNIDRINVMPGVWTKL